MEKNEETFKQTFNVDFGENHMTKLHYHQKNPKSAKLLL